MSTLLGNTDVATQRIGTPEHGWPGMFQLV